MKPIIKNITKSYLDLILSEIFLFNLYINNKFELPKIDKLILSFFFLNIKTLENSFFLNIYKFFYIILGFNKKPYIKKIFMSKQRDFKILFIFTFRKNEAFNFLDLLINKINKLSFLSKKTMLTLIFFKKQLILLIIIKSILFFDEIPRIFFNNNKFSVKCYVFFNSKIKRKKILLENIINFCNILHFDFKDLKFF